MLTAGFEASVKVSAEGRNFVVADEVDVGEATTTCVCVGMAVGTFVGVFVRLFVRVGVEV